MLRIALPLLMIAAACGAKKVQTQDYENAPRLPSPIAGTYARAKAEAPDPVIQKLTLEHQWDASLGGAAAGLALEAIRDKNTGLERWEVREAAWRAGYPYPIQQITGWTTPIATEPTGIRDWLGLVKHDQDLGLVRARGDRSEAWVGLVSNPRATIGSQPRQVRRGDNIRLPPIAGAKYIVGDPNGGLVEGSLDIAQDFEFDIDGEWLFDIVDSEGQIALFPIYVGMMPPDVGLLTWAPPPTTPEAIIERVDALLRDIREAYGAQRWLRDSFLDQGAENLLLHPEKMPASIASALGYKPESTWKWECKARSIEACLDQILWNPLARPALLTDSEFLGLAAAVNGRDIHLVALIARD
jgi:hypothetical protein